jgi:predicted dehydrogenase
MLGEVDAVIVATPMHLHARQAIAALNAGKHVLSEVTAAVTLTECWLLADAVRNTKAVYMLSENYCYIPDNVLVREMVRKGMFGIPYFGEGEYLHDCKYLHHNADGTPTWRYYYQVGTNGSTYPTHSLGPVMQWFNAADPSDRVASIVCVGTGRHTDPEHPHDDTSILLCTLQSGKLVKVRVDMISNRPHQMTYYALQGTEGVYEASRIGGKPGHVWLQSDHAGQHRNWTPLSEYAEHLPAHYQNISEEARQSGHGGGDFFVVRDWVEAIQNGTPPPIDVYTGLNWTAAGLCSQTSIDNNGVPICVPNFADLSERPVQLDAPQ